MSELHLTLHPGVYEGESELLVFFVVTSHVLTKVNILFLHVSCLSFFFFLYFSTALELSTTVQVTRALMSKTSCPHEPVVKKQRLNGLRVVDVQFTLSYREFLFHYDINSAQQFFDHLNHIICDMLARDIL